ncbi:MAG TPA: hypothetical protein VFV38_40070 [Ktedonobacteraceae bacterium]|nr:hypothetical protein [Ktedonobacteraceae bacterium]
MNSERLHASGSSETENGDRKATPPLYICVHRSDPACNARHPHPAGPTVYYNVTGDTPCRYCGHTGTLRKVN